MNHIFLNNHSINAINYLKEESQQISQSYDLHVTYIINIFIVKENETPIEINMKCSRNWSLIIRNIFWQHIHDHRRQKFNQWILL